jgi:Arm DNA-binding domain
VPERIKFTASRVGSLPIQAKEYTVWDETTPGFGVRVYPSGQRRYVYHYRAGASRSAPARMITIGDVRKLGLEDARRVARDLVGQVARGGDPSAEKRQSELDRVRKRRFADVCDGHRQVNGLTPQSPTGSAGQRVAARPVTSAQVAKAHSRDLR